VAIVVFGEDAYAEGLGDIQTLEYQPSDKRDLKLLQRLQAQGIPVVAVFLSGRPLYVTPEINASNAFVAAWQPGSEGEGISDMLFSNADSSVAYEFRGRLSFSWPRAPNQFALNFGQEPYFPLFAFGYGLTYGEPRNIGKLPEAVSRDVTKVAVSGAAPSAERSVLFENGEASRGWSVSAAGQRVISKTSLRGLTTVRSPSAGIEASWSTRVPVSLAIAGGPIGLLSESERGLSLSMVMRVDKAPTAAVVLAMGCGPLCGGKLDVTHVMNDAVGRGPMTISVPLSCLRNAGADLSNVSTPFALTTSGSFAISLSAVRIAREGEALSCAAVPPVTAAAVVPANSRRDYYVPSKHSSTKASKVKSRKKRSTPPTAHKRARR
jgi:beta-glucosidase